ncbi:MAG TPA: hypothetical protein VF692_09170 [Pyrinomonadaceae bacterium]
MKNLLLIILFVLASDAIGNAQEVITATAPSTASKITAEIIASSSTKVVKGAPFSAEGISESVQTLPDGNRITRSTTTKMYRDSDGRFRREGAGGGAVTFNGIVPVTGFPDTISIYDPVEGVRFMLTPSQKTARRFGNQNILTEGAVFVDGQSLSPAVKTRVETSVAQKTNVVVTPYVISGTMSGGKAEQLGTKSFEGVAAEGTRTVTTIEAGKIGNEKPIEIVYERWYSRELDLIVYSRHYDPRFGEQVYRLSNISRSEPDRSLFNVPSDYKLVAEPALKVYRTKPE